MGTERVQRSLQIALDHGLEELAGRAYVNLTWWAPRRRAYTEADRYIDAGLRYCEERGLHLWHNYLVAYRARAELERGRWGEAVECAASILRDPRTSPVPRIVALSVAGLVRARRGQEAAWGLLDEAWDLARGTGELQRVEPIAAARAEACWLEGRNDEVGEASAAALELALARGANWVIGEMLSWRRRAGVAVDVPTNLPEPFASELEGDWQRSAREWTVLDAPYEAALALSQAGDEDTIRESFEQLQRLGAKPAAAIVAVRLRSIGGRVVPRGPRSTTLANPAHLTSPLTGYDPLAIDAHVYDHPVHHNVGVRLPENQFPSSVDRVNCRCSFDVVVEDRTGIGCRHDAEAGEHESHHQQCPDETFHGNRSGSH